MAATKRVEIRPQPRQEEFLSSPADIAIYGGAAGGGKTWSLMLEPMRHADNSDFGAVIFRRTLPEILNEGGLWDESMKFYPAAGAQSNSNRHQHIFPSGMTITFGSLQYEKDLNAWKGSQIALMCFDQLETFTQNQFFYMLSRNRSMSGVQPYVRGTCNPEPGWLADFLDWWIGADGYAIPERSGKIRWMVRVGEEIIWSDTKEELLERFPDITPKSVTFILATVYDNEILMRTDPGYLSNLQALSLVDRERLLGHPQKGGNWKIKPSAGKLFNRDWVQIIDVKEVPAGGTLVRYWDFAATVKKISGKKSNDPDFTASCLMKKVGTSYYILHVSQDRISPAQTDQKLQRQAQIDGRTVKQKWEQEGGASGKRDSYHLRTLLDGYDTGSERPQGDKILRGKGFVSQAEAGNVYVVKGAFTEMWLEHMHAQPDFPHDDVWDATTGAYRELSGTAGKKPKAWSG